MIEKETAPTLDSPNWKESTEAKDLFSDALKVIRAEKPFHTYGRDVKETEAPLQQELNLSSTQEKEETQQVEQSAESQPDQRESVQSQTQPHQEASQQEQSAQPEDPFAGLPDDLKNKVLEAIQQRDYQWQRKYKSEVGRHTAYQKKYEQEREKRAKLEQMLAVQSKNARNLAQQQPSKSLKDNLEALPQNLRDVVETDPKLAEALKEYTDLRERDLEQRFEKMMDARFAPIHESRQVQERAHIEQTLDQSIPNWKSIIFETDERGNPVKDQRDGTNLYNPYWVQFLNDLHPEMRNFVENTESAEMAVYAINNLYAPWAAQIQQQYAAMAQQQNPQQQAQSSNNHPAQQTMNPVDRVQQKRQNDMKRSAPRANTPPLEANTIDEAYRQDDWKSSPQAKKDFQRALEAIRSGDLSKY